MHNNKLNNKIEKRVLKDGDFIIERTSQKDFAQALSFQIEEGAKVSYLLIVDEAFDLAVTRQWDLQNNSSLDSRRLFLQDKAHQTWSFQHEIGSKAVLNSRSLLIGMTDEQFNLNSVYNFSGQASFGRVNIDSLLTSKAQLNCVADVNVLPTAQQSDTRVDMTLRLESDEAKGEMTPGLNIAANDVKAGHSAGTFRLKEEDLFYLRSRGLSAQQIRNLFILSLAQSFAADLKDVKLKEELLALINNYL
ncbi:MAG: SufD family Fe-S cluster assembly protein [Patescibacteria group bacterium]|jgi:Fe-S cluster assembly protein SufD|nr:SufD family Fe-S cluster assembly protein [Patescibacteria group bacterium]